MNNFKKSNNLMKKLHKIIIPQTKKVLKTY